MTLDLDLEDLRLERLAALAGRIRANMPIFQPIAERAKARFGVPIALVSIIDATRQIYLGNCGIAAPSAPRDQTFCTYTIMSPTVVVVEDTLLDARFKDHPLVRGEPKLRFYAGAPILFADELRLGTVCLADNRPRSFTRADMMILEHFAAMVVQKISSLPDAAPGPVAAEAMPIEGVADPAERAGIRVWKARNA